MNKTPDNIIKAKSLAKKLYELCLREGFPMFVTVFLPTEEKDGKMNGTYHSEINSPKTIGIELADDRITQHLCVACGLKTTVPVEDSFLKYDSQGNLIIAEPGDNTDALLEELRKCNNEYTDDEDPSEE